MKNLSTTFRAALQDGGTLAYFLRIEPVSGPALGFSSYTYPLTFDGVTFDPSNGVDPSAFSQSVKGEAGSSEALIIFDDSQINEFMVISGYLDRADVTWFIADWNNPPSDIDATPADCLILASGRVGKVTGNDLNFRGEILTQEDRLSQSRTVVTQPRCRLNLGETPRCGATVLEFTGEIATVVSQRSLTYTADTPSDPATADEYCTNGRLVWLTGDNAGQEQKIVRHVTGEFRLLRRPFRSMQAGDRFQAFGGCNKILDEDCLNKYNNTNQFRGEPYVPGADRLIQNPDQNNNRG